MAKAPIQKRTAGRPAKSEVAPGIFKPAGSNNFSLRYTVNFQQVRVSLGTSDPAKAIRLADEVRGRAVVGKKTGRLVGGKTALDRAVEKYAAEKLKSGDFTEGSANAAKQAVKHFVKSMGAKKPPVAITSPVQITSPMLATYYAGTRDAQSEATAQTYSTRVATFCRWAGLRVTAPAFAAEAPSRTVVVSAGRVADLLDAATGDLKFILFAGFRCGMRRGEISMARPEWFDLESGLIHIPNPDPVTGFRPKSRRARTIPLGVSFRDFIRAEIPQWRDQAFCIRPEKAVGKWIYRFDFRKMLESFARTHCPELTAHVMRHSYASHCANGGVGIAQLAAWTGDRIATLEKHYLHLSADAEKAEEAFTAHKNPTAKQARDALAAQMNWLQEMLAAQAAQQGVSFWRDYDSPSGSNGEEVDMPVIPRGARQLEYLE